MNKIDIGKEKISIDISKYGLKAALFKNRKIKDYTFGCFQKNVINNGDIVDFISFRESIENISKKLNLKGKDAVVSIPSTSFIIRNMEIPNLEKDEQIALINNELEEMILDYAVEKHITDFIKIREDEEHSNIIVMTILKEKIEDIINIFAQNKIEVIKIVPDFISLYNLISLEDEFKDKTCLLLDIGIEDTDVLIIDNNVLKVYRSFKIDNSKIFEYNEKDFIINELGFESLDTLNNQIINVINFYRDQIENKGMDCLVVTGLDSQRELFSKYLSKSLGIDNKNMKKEIIEIENKEDLDKLDIVIGNIIEEEF